MSRNKISKLSKKEMRNAYKTLKKEVTKRVSTFKKHDRLNYIPKGMIDLPNMKDLDNASMVNKINEMGNFLLNKNSTYSKFMKREREIMENMEEDLNRKFKSYGEYEEFKRFVADMMKRNKKGTIKDDSAAYQNTLELWLQSKRLNLKADKFLKNYNYWLNNVDKLTNAKPIKTNRELKPSDYARQLRLPKIKK